MVWKLFHGSFLGNSFIIEPDRLTENSVSMDPKETRKDWFSSNS